MICINLFVLAVAIFVAAIGPSAAYRQNKLSSLPSSTSKGIITKNTTIFSKQSKIIDLFILTESQGHRNYISSSQRSKRSPFVVAFQVTRPPGLFQLSMRKPVIMGVMSNMTSMVLGSELARMLSRSLNPQQFFLHSNVTSSENSTKKYWQLTTIAKITKNHTV